MMWWEAKKENYILVSNYQKNYCELHFADKTIDCPNKEDKLQRAFHKLNLICEVQRLKKAACKSQLIVFDGLEPIK